jgi:hypothetical protein
MNRSQLWGFEVGHIVSAFAMLAGSNVILGMMGRPVIFSWVVGIVTLLGLRVISHGQKNGHLELLGRFVFFPHLYLGHQERRRGFALRESAQ